MSGLANSQGYPQSLSGSVATRVQAGVNDQANSSRTHATFQIIIIGIDTINGFIYGYDSTNAVIRQNTIANLAAGVSTFQAGWSNSKTIPANTVVGDVGACNIVAFGNFIWCMAKDQTSGLWGVYRASPQAGNTAWTWSAQLVTLTTGQTSGITSQLAACSSALFVWEYGDPVGGPHIFRITTTDANGAGTNWTTSFFDAAIRHIHWVTEDPYNLGTIWMTAGDGIGVKAIQVSTNNGVSWTTVAPASGGWQAVQISFSKSWVYFGADNNIGSPFFLNRVLDTPYWVPADWHHDVACPSTGWRKGGYVWTDGASNSNTTYTSATATFSSRDVGRLISGTNIPPNTVIAAFVNSTTVTLSQAATATATGLTFYLSTERFYSDAYWGVVDPATDSFYYVTSTASTWGNTHGMFWVPYPGSRTQLLYLPPEVGNGAQYAGNATVYANSNFVLWDRYIRPVKTVSLQVLTPGS